MDDPFLTDLCRQAEQDANTLGILLGGSRGVGCAVDDSDYDLIWVLTDDAYDQHRTPDLPQTTDRGNRPMIDLDLQCPRRLADIATTPGWWTPGYATAKILLDKTGELVRLLQAIAYPPGDKARADAGGWFGAYLNAFYRGLKAWRRGDELGACLHAADSVMYLVRTLFALEGRWPPYFDRLAPQLAILEPQGWSAELLHNDLLAVLRTGDPCLQQRLESQVEALMRARGFGQIVDEWGTDFDRVKNLHFE